MQEKTERTFTVRLYLSGPIEVAKQTIRRVALAGGMCATIEPTTFIYAGGEETGYVVGLLQYPRFPVAEHQIVSQARALMLELLTDTHQHSALMVTPEETTWISLRGQP